MNYLYTCKSVFRIAVRFSGIFRRYLHIREVSTIVISCWCVDHVRRNTEGFLFFSNAELGDKIQGIKESSRDQSPFEGAGEPSSLQSLDICTHVT